MWEAWASLLRGRHGHHGCVVGTGIIAVWEARASWLQGRHGHHFCICGTDIMAAWEAWASSLHGRHGHHVNISLMSVSTTHTVLYILRIQCLNRVYTIYLFDVIFTHASLLYEVGALTLTMDHMLLNVAVIFTLLY